MNLASRRAKIVATVGPASSDSQTLENLIKAGVDVFRMNFSHGTHEDHQERFKKIREAAKKIGKPVAVLQDLQGPKLRVGRFEGGSLVIDKSENVIFKKEDRNTVVKNNGKTAKTISYNYELLPSEIKVGHRILMDDGNLEVVVTGIKGEEIQAQVVFGGTLRDHKGMNFPDTKISIGSFTEKDREDLLLGMRLGVDFVALSFVRTADDIRQVQRFMHKHRKNIPVVAKIEMAEALVNLREILTFTDVVMVARGDLAVEIGTAQVPLHQKNIIRECRKRGVPVITATQMLESMISTPRPTRAEASDVANAVLDGTDALMLSAESASGKFPVLAVSTMHNIILETELRRDSLGLNPQDGLGSIKDSSIVEAIENAASILAKSVGAKVIVATTHTGHAARALAKFRPEVPIIAFTDDEEVRRKLALIWGVQSWAIQNPNSVEDLFELAEKKLVTAGVVHKNDLFVLTTGWPTLKHGTTNLLKVITVRSESAKKAQGSGKKGGSKVATIADEIQAYKTRSAQFVLDQTLCIQCGGCVEVCPNDIFGIEKRRVYLKESNCKNCTFDDACIEICPTAAIEIIKFGD